jgi:hypothetical protein
MKCDVSIILPSIRPKNLVKFYHAAEKACIDSSFEIIITSPYLIPEELLKKKNVTFLHSFCSPTIAIQKAVLLANGEFILNMVDDGIFEEGVIDLAVSSFRQNCKERDIINMSYLEGALDVETLEPLPSMPNQFPQMYWYAMAHGILAEMGGVHGQWGIGACFFVKRDTFVSIGGLDCVFEYSNHAILDFLFRLQSLDGKSYQLPRLGFKCSFIPEKVGDHAPVHNASVGPDITNFNRLWKNPRTEPLTINYYDWRKYPNIWAMRFDENNLKLQP